MLIGFVYAEFADTIYYSIVMEEAVTLRLSEERRTTTTRRHPRTRIAITSQNISRICTYVSVRVQPSYPLTLCVTCTRESARFGDVIDSS